MGYNTTDVLMEVQVVIMEIIQINDSTGKLA